MGARKPGVEAVAEDSTRITLKRRCAKSGFTRFRQAPGAVIPRGFSDATADRPPEKCRV